MHSDIPFAHGGSGVPACPNPLTTAAVSHPTIMMFLSAVHRRASLQLVGPSVIILTTRALWPDIGGRFVGMIWTAKDRAAIQRAVNKDDNWLAEPSASAGNVAKQHRSTRPSSRQLSHRHSIPLQPAIALSR
jgi:hypothetical protein